MVKCSHGHKDLPVALKQRNKMQHSAISRRSLYKSVLFKLLFGLRPLISVKHLETITSVTDATDKDSLKYYNSNVIEA